MPMTQRHFWQTLKSGMRGIYKSCTAQAAVAAQATVTDGPAHSPKGQPQQVGGDKQLFIDHRFIESSENINLVVNPPVKRPGPVLRCDKPWDALSLGWYSIVEDEGVYKMWYYGADRDPRRTIVAGEQAPVSHMSAHVVPAGSSQMTRPPPGKLRLCYAVSQDGLTWEKPNLGLVEFQGSTDNNIVHEDLKLSYVFIDPHGKAEERFKLIHWTGPGIAVKTSPDGLHWDQPSHQVSTLAPDTQKMAWWEPRLNKYVAYFRLTLKEENAPPFPFVGPIESHPPVVAPKTMRPGRAVGRVEVDDILAPWPEEDIRTVLTADEHDPPDSDIYTHGLYRYPYAADAYFMFPMVYQHFREDETTVPNDGLNDSQFCASRDGIHWMRYDRKPYVPRGLPGDPDCGMTHTGEFHIRKGHYLYQYYSGGPWTHGGYRRLSEQERGDKKNWGRIYYGVVIQRLDGFVSADAPYTGGSLVTPPIVFQGKSLELNINVAAMGEARVEIQDEDGQPMSGFALDNCDRILFNDVAYRVKWQGKSDVSALSGRPVRLRIWMRSAKLYAFQFVQ